MVPSLPTENDETLLFSDDSRSRPYYDAMDKARELLENHKDLSQAIPSCVVVGMQSVGKSAVLNRLSGIPFPQDSEVCTRVAMELRLRRSADDTGAGLAITAGKEPLEIKSSSDCITDVLKQAQTDVLNGRDFEDKLSIKIDKVGPSLPDVTLVDLPGVFFAKSKEKEALETKVKAMIAERIKNEMALICHVVPLNQDTDTISTWRMVGDADPKQARTISILTKGDLAFKDGKDILQNRLSRILKDGSTSEYFLVHGAAKSHQDEENQLSCVRDYVEQLRLTDQILIGSQQLIEHIAKRNLDHIKEKIPEMKRLLEIELTACKDELVRTGRTAKTPMLIATKDIEAVLEVITCKTEENRPWIRSSTEEMAKKIFDIPMDPLGDVDKGESRSALKAKFLGFAPTQRAYELHTLAMEAKKLQEESRVHINVPFVGTRVELQQWLSQFVAPCSAAAEEHVREVFHKYRKDILRPALHSGLSDSTKKLEWKVEAVLAKVVNDACDQALGRVREFCDGVRDNLFTTNDHYLVETADALKQDHAKLFEKMAGDYAAEMKPYFDTVYSIMAFIKTRKKMIPDTVQVITKGIVDHLHKEIKETLQDCMFEDGSLALIGEPAALARKRQFNLEREQQIEKVFEALRIL